MARPNNKVSVALYRAILNWCRHDVPKSTPFNLLLKNDEPPIEVSFDSVAGKLDMPAVDLDSLSLLAPIWLPLFRFMTEERCSLIARR
jgi:hypothetical protein